MKFALVYRHRFFLFLVTFAICGAGSFFNARAATHNNRCCRNSLCGNYFDCEKLKIVNGRFVRTIFRNFMYACDGHDPFGGSCTDNVPQGLKECARYSCWKAAPCDAQDDPLNWSMNFSIEKYECSFGVGTTLCDDGTGV
jgi:hypothetical protein